MKEKFLDQAIEALEQAIALDAREAAYQYNLACCYMAKEDVSSACGENGEVWRYYKKDASTKYYEQKAQDISDSETPTTSNVLYESQITDIFNTAPYSGTQIIVVEDSENYRGVYMSVRRKASGLRSRSGGFQDPCFLR